MIPIPADSRFARVSLRASLFAHLLMDRGKRTKR
jgi:hypothetical protein